MLASGARAQTVFTWSGGGANANWSTNANWLGGAKPTESASNPDDQLVFAGTNQLVNNMDLTGSSGGFNIGMVTFDNTAGAFVLGATSASGLDMLGPNRVSTAYTQVINNSTNLQTINIKLIARADLSFGIDFVAASGDMVIGGAISTSGTVANVGAGGIKKSGAGTVTLSGTNTYTGVTVVNAGILRAGSTSAFGTNSNVTLADGTSAVLDLNNFSNTIGSLTGTATSGGGSVTLGSGTLTINTTSSTTYAGVISGTGGIAKSASGTQTLSGNNTFSGGANVTGGGLTMSGNNTFGAGTVTLNGSATTALTLSGTNTFTSGGITITLGNANISGSDSFTTGSLSFAAGTTTISASLTLGSGNITVTGGTETISSSSNSFGSGSLSVTTGSLTLSGNNNALGTGGITVNSGTLTLGGTTNTGGGVTTINGGVVKIAADGATAGSAGSLGSVPNTFAAGNIVLNGGTLQDTVALNLHANRGVQIGTSGGSIVAGAAGNFFVNGVISDQTAGAGALTIGSGPGAYVPAAQNTYSGGTILASGSTTIAFVSSTGGVSGPFGVGTVTFAGGSFRATTSIASLTIQNNLLFTGNTTFISAGAGADKDILFTGTATLTGTRTFTVNTSPVAGGTGVSFNGVIGDGGGGFGINKAGPGTLVLAAANTYSGDTTITAGTLLANNTTGSATGTGNVNVQSGGTLGGKGTVGVTTGASTISIQSGGLLLAGKQNDTAAAILTLATNASTGTVTIAGDTHLDLIHGSLSGATMVAGTDNDKIVFTSSAGTGTGTPTLSGNLFLDTTLPATSSNFSVGTTWDLFDWANVSTAFANLPIGGTMMGNPTGLPDLTTAGAQWDWTNLYTTGIISVASVPEPCRALFIVSGLAALLLRRQRPRK